MSNAYNCVLYTSLLFRLKILASQFLQVCTERCSMVYNSNRCTHLRTAHAFASEICSYLTPIVLVCYEYIHPIGSKLVDIAIGTGITLLCFFRTYGWKGLQSLKKTRYQFLLLYIVTFLVVLPIICRNLQFSVYNFTKMDSKYGRDRMVKENQVRFTQIEQKRKYVQKTDLFEKMWKLQKPDLIITVITTLRRPLDGENYKPNYLTQVVWKMLWLIYRAQKTKTFDLKVRLSVCNVDSSPELHEEAMDFVSSLRVINKYINQQDKSYRRWNVFEKEKQDYMYCLNSSLVDNPKFVLLVEDDSLPEDDLFSVLNTVVSKDSPFHTSHYEPSSKFDKQYKAQDAIFIKLYHPDRLLGYISLEPDRLTELFGISSVFGTILFVFYSIAINRRFELLRNHRMLWIILMLYVALVVMAIGRPHLLNLRRLYSPYFYSFMSAPECCTPAMLFPNKGAHKVVQLLNREVCYAHKAKDTLLYQYIQQEDHRAFLVQPNLFKHIGYLSSLRQKFLDPYVV